MTLEILGPEEIMGPGFFIFFQTATQTPPAGGSGGGPGGEGEFEGVSKRDLKATMMDQLFREDEELIAIVITAVGVINGKS